jgi:glycosyltransferase involved in cell wall biosynthesis
VEKVLVNARHYSLAEQWRFWKILNAAKLDLMHFTHFNAPVLYRRPSVVTIHDLTLSLYPGKKMRSPWVRMAYHFTIRSIVKRASSVIAVSEHTKKDLVNLLHTNAAKINVVHEGVNPIFHKINDQHIIDDFKVKMGFDRPYILYTGVWRSHKNLVNLIRAFAILKHRYKFPGILVITGKEDPWYPEVKQTVNEEKLCGEVRFTGLVPDEDLVLLYNAASVYVLPSLYEGFGLPVLESFACGVPVCAARSSSLPEICGNAAELFDPKDPADIAAKVNLVYKDAAKREELIVRGRARVKEFSWEKMAKETLAIYNKK